MGNKGTRWRDLRVRRGMPSHLKTRKIRARFGLEAVGALLYLWHYAGDVSPADGNLGKISLEDLGILSSYGEQFPERAEEFGRALIEIGFVDQLEGGELEVHGWIDEQEHIVASAEQEIAFRESQAAKGRASRDARKARFGTAQPRFVAENVTATETPSGSKAPRTETTSGSEPPEPTTDPVRSAPEPLHDHDHDHESPPTPREAGTNSRASGTNPRAQGTNPRAKGTNPRTNPGGTAPDTPGGGGSAPLKDPGTGSAGPPGLEDLVDAWDAIAEKHGPPFVPVGDSRTTRSRIRKALLEPDTLGDLWPVLDELLTRGSPAFWNRTKLTLTGLLRPKNFERFTSGEWLPDKPRDPKSIPRAGPPEELEKQQTRLRLQGNLRQTGGQWYLRTDPDRDIWAACDAYGRPETPA